MAARIDADRVKGKVPPLPPNHGLRKPASVLPHGKGGIEGAGKGGV
jgi:hypothetical protein